MRVQSVEILADAILEDGRDVTFLVRPRRVLRNWLRQDRSLKAPWVTSLSPTRRRSGRRAS